MHVHFGNHCPYQNKHHLSDWHTRLPLLGSTRKNPNTTPLNPTNIYDQFQVIFAGVLCSLKHVIPFIHSCEAHMNPFHAIKTVVFLFFLSLGCDRSTQLFRSLGAPQHSTIFLCCGVSCGITWRWSNSIIFHVIERRTRQKK